MAGYYLLILNEGFDDMSFLSSQVILEEHNNDVIIASTEPKTIKGETSSVITVGLQEALSQNIKYDGLIVVGGHGLSEWPLLKDTLRRFQDNGKPIGLIAEGVDIFNSIYNSISVSSDASILQDGKVLSMKLPEDPETFVEKFLSL